MTPLAEGMGETIGLRVPADSLIEGVAVLAGRGRFADLDSFLRELDEISDRDLRWCAWWRNAQRRRGGRRPAGKNGPLRRPHR